MFNLFSKKEEPEDNTPSEEEMEKIVQKYREQRKKQTELYNRIIKNDEYLTRALRMMVHRIDIATDSSLLSEIGTLESHMEEMFPESND